MRTRRAARRLTLLLAACAVPGSPGAAALGVAGRVRVIPSLGTPAIGAVGGASGLRPLSLSSAGTLLPGASALPTPAIPAAAVPIAAKAALPRAQAASVVRTPAAIAPAASGEGLGFESATRTKEPKGAVPRPVVALAGAAVSYGPAVFDGSPARGRANHVLPGALRNTAGALSRASGGMLASLRRGVPSPTGPAGAAAASGWLAAGAALAAQFPLLDVLSGGMTVAAAMPLVIFLFGRSIPVVPDASRAAGAILALPFRLGFPPEAVRRSAWTLVLSLPILAVAWLAWSYPPFVGIRIGLAAAALGPLPVYLSVRLATGLVRALGRGWSDVAVSGFGLSAALLIIGGGIFSGADVAAALAPAMATLGAMMRPELGLGLVLGGTVPPLALLFWGIARFVMSRLLMVLPPWASAPFHFIGAWLKAAVPPQAAVDVRLVAPLVLLPAAAAGILILASPSSALIPGLLAAALLAVVQFLLHNALAGFAQAVFWAAGARVSRGGAVVSPWRMAAAVAGLAALSAALLWFAAPALALSPAATGLGAVLLLAFPAALALMRRAEVPLDPGRRDGKVV